MPVLAATDPLKTSTVFQTLTVADRSSGSEYDRLMKFLFFCYASIPAKRNSQLDIQGVCPLTAPHQQCLKLALMRLI